MGENPKLETGDTSLSFESCGLDEMGTQKISVSDQTNSLQFTNIKSDSFTVDMDRLSHLTSKDVTANSRITLQRNLSRKGSHQRGSDKKIKSISSGDQIDTIVLPSSSPRGTSAGAGASTPEKPTVMMVGTAEHAMNPQVHHQITIMTGNVGTSTAESRLTAKRFSFKRSPSWTINPRRILFFFATLSSMGTILLIYFTLSIGKQSGEDSALNQ